MKLGRQKGKQRTAYSGFKKLAVQWLNEHLCFVSNVVPADSLALRNPLLRQALKLYSQCN